MSLPAHRPRRILALLTVLGSCAALLCPAPATARIHADADAVAAMPPGPAQPSKIDRELADRMRSARSTDGRVEAVVVLGTRPDLDPVRSRRTAVRNALVDTARTSQAPVVRLVTDSGDQVVNTFWLKNMVLVRARPATLEALTGLPAVERVIPNLELSRPELPPARTQQQTVAGDSTWGLTKIGADRVQDERGITGEGVRVAVLDTGIDITHPDLRGRLVTDDAQDATHPGGWIEFGSDGRPVRSEPHDSSTHGTHVAGTIAGGNSSGTRIGVAPGVELMAGLVIPGGSGSLTQVIAGMEWAIAPFDADGRPAGRPADIVSMSLGAEGHFDEMIEPARNIYYAGSFPAFAVGNDCLPGASSSPANVYESVAVGATDVNDDVGGFSCGEVVERDAWISAPGNWPERHVVPDVSAPGVAVLSAVPGGGYDTYNGTSMATPHVAGTVALMLQARPDLGVDETLDILKGTAFFDDRYGARPNPRYGWGRIDAAAAVAEAALTSGIRGTVTDSRSGTALAGVTVTREGSDRSLQTGADGTFEVRLPAGTYDVSLTRFGYHPTTRRIQVSDGAFTAAGLELAPTRRGHLSGRVTYGPTGTPVPAATVTVSGVPDPLHALTDLHGRYTIRDVPEGSYQVVASAPGVSRSEPTAATVGHAAPPVDITLPEPFPTERVSLTPAGTQSAGEAWWPKISADGQVVAFASFGDDFVADDTNGDLDIFVTDRGTRETTRVSVSSEGAQGNSFSLSPTLGANGRLVGFNSGASNLVPDDTNGVTEAFVHDRQTGTTERLSVSSDGTGADGSSGAPWFSGDGRYAAFVSDATNLVAGDTNGATDIFVRDRQTGVTERVSVGAGGSQGNASSREQSISADGRYVAFHSDASNLVLGDTNGHTDIFVRNRQTGATERIDGVRPGENREPTISADGRMVSFTNRSAPVWQSQVWVHDRQTGTTQQASIGADGQDGAGGSYGAAFSADGQTITFNSTATNLVTGDTDNAPDVFVRDLAAGTTERVSSAPKGVDGDGWSQLPAISSDSRYVAFQSTSGNLVDGDTNRLSDIFVHDRVAGPQARYAVSDLSIAPTTGRAGRPVRVNAWVTNVGQVGGSYTAILRVDGAVEETQPVRVDAGKATRISFTVIRRTPGAYTVQLGPLNGTLTIDR